jgi:hypothetical protein
MERCARTRPRLDWVCSRDPGTWFEGPLLPRLGEPFFTSLAQRLGLLRTLAVSFSADIDLGRVALAVDGSCDRANLAAVAIQEVCCVVRPRASIFMPANKCPAAASEQMSGLNAGSKQCP